MPNFSAGILGIGTYVPEKVLTNFDLEKMVDTNDEWIRVRTGISERRIAAEDESTSDLAAKAAKAAIEDAGIDPGEIDLILLATASPDMIFPSTACLTQHKLGIKGCAAFDIQAVCTGFPYALATASQFIETGMYKKVLVIGAETMSRLINWEDRRTCILFGDGAGAFVLGRVEKGYGVVSNFLAADGSGSDMLKVPAGGTARPASHETIDQQLHFVQMNGNEVFKFAVRIIPTTVITALEAAGLKVDDIDYFIPHQANIRIIDSAIKKLGVPKAKVVVNLSKYANTSSASIPLALNDIYKAKSLKRGDILLFVGFGAGLTWGANVVRWY
jgi:3-oxoacyl-[acyl-carrier-protein] synthase-3